MSFFTWPTFSRSHGRLGHRHLWALIVYLFHRLFMTLPQVNKLEYCRMQISSLIISDVIELISRRILRILLYSQIIRANVFFYVVPSILASTGSVWALIGPFNVTFVSDDNYLFFFVATADVTKKKPPSLYRVSSMQKIRHCCQNINLLPYLLYSFSNPKANVKVNVYISLFLNRIAERIFRVYASIRHTIIRGLPFEITRKSIAVCDEMKCTEQQRINEVTKAPQLPKFAKFERQKPKQSTLALKLAVYLAQFVLAFQLIGILSLLIFGKYTPGFIFLLSALLFLGYISMKVLSSDGTKIYRFKHQKRKIE